MTNKTLFRILLHNNENKIRFENVYHNGFHSLQQLHIQNETDNSIVIQFNSTLHDQIMFQSTNENLVNFTNNNNNIMDFSHFNQLFNYINHIHHITLEPLETKSLVIGFLPHDNPAPILSTITGIVSFSSCGYHVNVDFEASYCQSILSIDELDTDIIFEDCLIGETYMRDITLYNSSAIDLYWKLNTSDLSFNDCCLQFVDAYHPINPIPPFSHYTFSILFTPKEHISNFNYDLQIENLNDLNNIIQSKIHATIRNFIYTESLIIPTGNILDFGDCIAGCWSKQQIVLKNVSEYSIDIHFIADGADLSFNKPELVQSLFHHEMLLSPDSSSMSSENNKSLLTNSNDSSSPISNLTHSTSSQEGSIHADIDDINMLYNFKDLFIQDSIEYNTVIYQENTTKIEDIVLKAGAEKTILISYRPEKDDPKSIQAGQFKKQNNFKIMLEYRPNKSLQPKELKLIQCKARTCTSFVKVSPKTIDFGNTNVGTQKSLPIQITNLSDICAHVELDFESKVLSCTQREILIQPHDTVQLKLDIYPRKINPAYRRQIKLVNYLNRDNDQIIEVSSTNTDHHKVTFHSLFYQILTPTGANFLDFGPTALHSPALRTCTIINKRNKPLLLDISSSLPQEIIIYTKKQTPFKKLTLSKTMHKEPSFVPAGTLVAMNHRTKLTHVQYASTAYLDLATVPHVQLKHRQKKLPTTTRTKETVDSGITTCKKPMNWPDIAGKSRIPLDDLISILEYGSLARTPLFGTLSSEEQFVKYQLAWRTELERLIEKGQLIPTRFLQLNSNQEQDILVVYTPQKQQESNFSLTTAAISFRLVNFDYTVLRKMIVRAQVIKSTMELGQRYINFGMVEKGERHHKTIILHNKSETPLLYSIKKSGSIASGDIHLGVGRHGVIRAFGKREIEFVFVPTLPGQFMEQLIVHNIRDKHDKNIISLKAIVRRPESFQVTTRSEQLVIGPFCPIKSMTTGIETIIVTNTHSRQSKTFEIRIESITKCKIEYSAIFQHQKDSPEELEEEIEGLEQKLKIAMTKNKTDKIKKYTKKLQKLKQVDVIGIDYKILDDETMLFTLGPNMLSQISICFKAYRLQKNLILNSTMSGRILVYEHKNMDTCKAYPFTAVFCIDHESCFAD